MSKQDKVAAKEYVDDQYKNDKTICAINSATLVGRKMEDAFLAGVAWLRGQASEGREMSGLEKTEELIQAVLMIARKWHKDTYHRMVYSEEWQKFKDHFLEVHRANDILRKKLAEYEEIVKIVTTFQDHDAEALGYPSGEAPTNSSAFIKLARQVLGKWKREEGK